MYEITFPYFDRELISDTFGLYMTMSTVYVLVGMTVFTTIIEIVRRQYEESMRKMQELRAQIQAQLKLADTLKKISEAAGKMILALSHYVTIFTSQIF